MPRPPRRLDALPRPLSRAGWLAVGAGLLAVAGVLWAATAPLPSLAASEPAAGGGPRQLTIWVIDGNRTGIALGLKATEPPPGTVRPDLSVSACKFDDPAHCGPGEGASVGLHQVLRDLLDDLDDLDDEVMYPFAVTWSRAGAGAAEPIPLATVTFKFARSGSLIGGWKPLFDRCVTGRTLKEMDRDYPDTASWFIEPAWRKGLDWLGPLEADLRAARRTKDLVILGPDTSDAIPALWFELAHALPEPAGYMPPVLSAASTATALGRFGQIDLPAGPDCGPECLQVDDDGSRREAQRGRRRAHEELGRMRGYSAEDFRLAEDDERRQVHKALRRIRPAAATLVQYPEVDYALARVIVGHLARVQGLRRIAILYRDSGASGRAEDTSPGPDRRLYGPGLRVDYQRVAVELGVDPLLYAPFPASSSTDDGRATTGLEGWAKATRERLLPILRHFEREGVEAVGVFGGRGEERALLQVVREQLPGVQLFTSDADWELESPGPAGEVEGEISGRRPGYALDGLLVVTSTPPDREWVTRQFATINDLSAGAAEVTLPGLYDHYTAHLTQRLVDLALADDLARLDPAAAGRDDRRPLAEVLRDPTRWERADAAAGREAAGRASEIRLMMMRNGRLRPLAEPQLGARNLIFGGVVSLAVLGYLALLRPGAGEDGLREPITPLDWLAQRVRSGGFGAGSQARIAGVLALVTLLGLVLMVADAALALPVSQAALPDGHSVLPSVVAMSAAAALAYYLPHRFRAEFASRGLLAYRRERQEPSRVVELRRWVPPLAANIELWFDWVVAEWVSTVVESHLRLTDLEATWTGALAAALVVLDLAVGMPVPSGLTSAYLVVFEFFVLWTVIASAWTLGEMAETPGELRAYFSRADGPMGFRLRHLDLMGVGRTGTVFIETIAALLLVFGLLMIARLPALGMPRWRWEWPGSLAFPFGFVLAGLALAFILGYWLYCYSSLRSMIREIKADRIHELDELRLRALATSVDDQQRDQVSRDFQAQRREVEQIDERPWGSGQARRAWVALVLALLPPLLTGLLGAWGDSLMQFLRSILS